MLRFTRSIPFIFLLVNALVGTAALSANLSAKEEPRPYRAESSGEGRAVYLLPGLSNPGWVWDDLAGRLREAGYRTHVLTLAGFAGQPPIDVGDGQFLASVRDALAADLAGESGPDPVVIGHSLGGFLSFWLAATESDRLAGVVAVDGVPFLSGLAGEGVTAESQRESAEQMASFMASLTPEQFEQQNRMSLQVMVSDPELRQRVGDDSVRSDPATVGRAVAEMMTTDLRPMMGDVDIPVLLVQAADSGANAAMRQAYADQVADIPDHRHVVAEKGRHFVQLDDPDFLAGEVLEFLARIEQDSNDE